jgi:hypothetical protein
MASSLSFPDAHGVHESLVGIMASNQDDVLGILDLDADDGPSDACAFDDLSHHATA